MVDRAARAAERVALSDGTPEAEARRLVERMRAGELEREWVVLAAYCGDEWARLAAPNCLCWSGRPETRNYHTWDRCGSRHESLDQWLKKLARWGDVALVRAEVAAAWAVQVHEERAAAVFWDARADGYNNTDAMQLAPSVDRVLAPQRRALVAADAYLHTLGPDELAVWEARWEDQVRARVGNPEWIPHPADTGRELGRRSAAATRVAGERAVREAIQRELIEWALR